MKIREYTPHCIAYSSLLVLFILPFFLPPIYAYYMVSGIFFLLAAWLVVQIFRVSCGFARLAWVVSICIFLCVGSWAYYDEFKIFNQRGSEDTFQIKHQVSLEHGLFYGFRFFVGVWAIYFIWKLLNYLTRCDNDDIKKKRQKAIGHMKIKEILIDTEYTRERSASELLEFLKQKRKELKEWSSEHSGTKTLKKMRYRELDKGLPYKLEHELAPFAYYASTYYGDKPEIRFKPCCGSEQYDGIIIDNNKKIFVEITDAKFGRKWALQKELLIEKGWSPWEHDILGVKGKKTKRKRTVDDIITSDDGGNSKDAVLATRELVKEIVHKKCKTSIKIKLPYGENKTILIVTFDDTCFSENDRNEFVKFKQTEIDSMKHNFVNITLFGWNSKKFMV